MALQPLSELVCISLRPPSKEPKGPTPLPEFWRRVNQERGGILNVTEESLTEEIRKQKRDESLDNATEDSAEDEPQDLESRWQQLSQAKSQMLDAVKWVHNTFAHVASMEHC